MGHGGTKNIAWVPEGPNVYSYRLPLEPRSIGAQCIRAAATSGSAGAVINFFGDGYNIWSLRDPGNVFGPYETQAMFWRVRIIKIVAAFVPPESTKLRRAS